MFSLEESRLRGELINAYKYLQGRGQEDGAKLFSVVPSDRTRGNGHKLKQRKLQLKMRKNFFPLRVTEPWPRLPRGAGESPSLEIFQPRLAAVLCSLLWVTLLRQGVGLGDPQRALPTPTILRFCECSEQLTGNQRKVSEQGRVVGRGEAHVGRGPYISLATAGQKPEPGGFRSVRLRIGKVIRLQRITPPDHVQL